jgi:nitroreductase
MTGLLLDRLIDALPAPGAPARFSPRELGAEEQTALLAAARVAPSADNLQTWRFVVVRSAEGRAALSSAVEPALAEPFRHAPVAVAVCGVRGIVSRLRREQPFVLVDVPIALVHLLLEAAELGLRCAWTLDPDEAAVKRALAIPEEKVSVIALCALGWPE